jgi:hypothetical protein
MFLIDRVLVIVVLDLIGSDNLKLLPLSYRVSSPAHVESCLYGRCPSAKRSICLHQERLIVCHLTKVNHGWPRLARVSVR